MLNDCVASPLFWATSAGSWSKLTVNSPPSAPLFESVRDTDVTATGTADGYSASGSLIKPSPLSLIAAIV